MKASAADYFIAASGDDRLPGLSPGAAWRSIARVNSNYFQAGDRILFAGGQSFRGHLRMDHRSAGSSNAPVVITSFGEGRATILAGHDTAITIDTAGFVTISNLIVRGDGPTNNIGYGVLCDNRLDTFQRLSHICVAGVEAAGFGVFGILISGQHAGFDHVRVIGCDLHDNLRGGMEIAGRLSWDSPLYAHSDVIVTHCRAHDNPGDPNYDKNHSGSGMVLYQVDGGLIEACRAWGNGAHCRHGNGGVGIWTCASRNVVIQHCESFANRTSGGDGGGFDLDGGSIGCVLQYNYSHDNDGPGLMAYTYAYASYADKNNVICFNISDRDARQAGRYAGLWVTSDGNGMTGLKVYNNTVRAGPNAREAAYVNGKGIDANFDNNIFIAANGAPPLVVDQPEARLHFKNNLYWSGGAPFHLQWDSHSYDSLAAWRFATGQETAQGAALGLFADPEFLATAISRPDDWSIQLAAYKPRSVAALQWVSLPEGIALSPTDNRRLDILGRPLPAEKAPFGAISPGL